MRFWQLQSPDYDDYRDSYINGALTYPFTLPLVKCETCGKGHSIWRVLPLKLPAAFHKRKEIRERPPLRSAEFQRLANEIEVELRAAGIEAPKIESGDRFQPGYLDVPSKPRADFLWSTLGSPVVSERIRVLLTSLKLEDVEFSPVTLRKIGSKEAKLRPPVPASGEPEGILDSVPLLKSFDKLGPYYHLIVHGRSEDPPGGKPLWICPDCGWKSMPPAPAVRFVMLDSMWRGQEVFFLGGTAMLMVTDRLKLALQKLGATNVECRSRAEELKVTPFASALRQAQCCYCGGQPCVGTDLSFKTFMCNACTAEYYRYTQDDLNRMPSGLAQGEQEKRVQTILVAADAHMKKWVPQEA